MAMTCDENIKKIEENNRTIKIQNHVNHRIEYLSALAAAFGFGIVGLHVGWIGPTLVKLMNEDTSPILVTSSQSSLVSGFLQIGTIPGPFLGSFLANYFGRKQAIIFCGIPNIISFLLIILAKNVLMLYIARFFCGLAVGVYFVSVPTYISEISSPDIRGRLIFITSILMNLFTLFEYGLVPFVSIRLNAIVCLIIAILQVIVFLPVCETPYFYVMKNKDELMEKSLKKLRQTDDVTEEIKELKAGWLKQQESSARFLDIINTSLNRRSLFIIIGLIMTQQLSGLPALLAYSQILFKKAEAPIPVAVSGIIFIASNFIMSIISTFFVDWWGRKPLFLASALGTVLPLVMTGTFFYLQDMGYENIEDYSVIPVIGLILYTAAFGIGLLSIPYLICGEIFSTEYRAMAASILSIAGSIFGLITTELYQVISDSYGEYINLWLFAFFNVAGALFGLIFLPETNGKSLEEIQNELRLRLKDNNSNKNKNNN